MTTHDVAWLLERATIGLRETGSHAGAASAIARHPLELDSILAEAANRGLTNQVAVYRELRQRLDPPPRPTQVMTEARATARVIAWREDLERRIERSL